MKGKVLRLIPGVAVSLGFMAWFVSNAHWAEVADALREVHAGWLVASAAVLFTEFAIRALRWKVLLRPLAPDARFGRLFVATVIGMSLNVVLPFRAGDFARPWLGSRETGLGVLPLATIAVIERVFDILGLVSVLLIMVAILPADAQAAASLASGGGELVTNLKLYGGLLGGVGITCLVVFLALAAREHAARGVFARIVSIAPTPVARRFLQLFDGFAEGFASIRSRRALAEAGALSLVHWLNGSISIFLLFKAFAIVLPFAAACFTTVAIALAAALPQAPGFFGVFHKAIEMTLVLWGQPLGPAQAFAIVFWAVSFVPIATVGGLLCWAEGLSPARIREEMDRTGAEVAAK